MNRSTRAAAAALALAATAALGGCAIIAPTAPVRTPSAIEACAQGTTWSLDMAALQTQVVAAFAEAGIAVSEVVVEGTEDFTWDDDGHVSIASDYSVRATAPSDVPEAPFVVTQTISGTTTGRAYFSDVVAVPRDWDMRGLDVETTAVKGAQPVDPPPFAIPKTIVDDVVGLEVTCTPESMTTHGRGGHMTLTWTPKG